MNPPKSSAQSSMVGRVSNGHQRSFAFDITFHYIKLLQLLKAETNIRIIVGTASGTGHQSSAILMTRLITKIWSDADPGNESNKTVYLIYEVDSNVKTLLETAPVLKQDAPTINGINVRLQKSVGFTNRTYTFGFAGAYDGNANLAKKMKVKYFLLLQPLFWRHMDEIHYNDWSSREEEVITHLINYDFIGRLPSSFGAFPKLQILNAVPDFRCLGYSFQTPAEPSWNDETAVETKIRQTLLAAEAGTYDLCVGYSIGSGTVYPNSTSEILFNLASGCAQAKRQNVITKNHVIFLNFTRDMKPKQIEVAKLMLLSPEERATALDELPDTSLTSKVEIETLVANLNGSTIYRDMSDAKLKFHSVDILDAKNELPTILGNTTNFHFILLTISERQKKEVFDFSLSKVTLFSLFEGSGTASVAATIGKPYLKLNLLPGTAPQYLFYPNGHEVMDLGAATFCQNVANCLGMKFSDWKELIGQGDLALLPSNLIKNFLSLYKVDDKLLEVYFNTCKDFYQKEENTRLYIALGLFHMLIKNKSARKNQ